MKRLMPVAMLLLASCTPKPPPDPAVAAALSQFKAQYEERRTGALRSLHAQEPKTSRDFRGRTLSQDLDDWVFSRRTREQIEGLQKDAADLRGEDARGALTRASDLVQSELARASQISFYWMAQRPAPYWRDYWRAFFESNYVPVPEPGARLLDIEHRMRDALDAGDFKAANADAAQLVLALHEAISNEAHRFRNQTAVTFTPRKSPCGPDTAPIPWQDKAKFVGGESLEKLYPPGATERGEEGAVILRLRIARSGCITAAGIVMHSGITDLDAAALQWVEAARFAPASSNGQAIDSEYPVKLVFRLEESAAAK
jgi:TonB family protein